MVDIATRIMKATREILDETGSIDQITVRRIAERANVGVGLINYHFKSKDNLLGTAMGNEMGKICWKKHNAINSSILL